jgi:hypothetical protein
MEKFKKTFLILSVLLFFLLVSYLSDEYDVRKTHTLQTSETSTVLGVKTQAPLVPQKKLLIPQNLVIEHIPVSVIASTDSSSSLFISSTTSSTPFVSRSSVVIISMQPGFGGGGGGSLNTTISIGTVDAVDGSASASSVGGGVDTADTVETTFPNFTILSPEISASSSACGN